MLNIDLYEDIKDFKSKSSKVYDVALENEDKLSDLTSDFIQSDVMKETFEELDSEDYTEFQEQLISFLGSIVAVFESNTLTSAQVDSLRSYKKILQKMNKD